MKLKPSKEMLTCESPAGIKEGTHVTKSEPSKENSAGNSKVSADFELKLHMGPVGQTSTLLGMQQSGWSNAEGGSEHFNASTRHVK